MSETYYRDTEGVPFASRLGMQARRKIYAAFSKALRPQPDDTVLDVGVTSNTERQESNFFEQFYPYKNRITCVGTEDGSHLELRYPGLRFQAVKAGALLPFKDRQFDIAFSNAVLEHTGSTTEQAQFIAEIARVSRRFFIATPNRWFPVEHHTGLPLLHYLPQPLYRSLLRKTRYRFWAEEANLHMLSRRDLRRLMPKSLECDVVPIRVLGLVSNLAVWGPAVGSPISNLT